MRPEPPSPADDRRPIMTVELTRDHLAALAAAAAEAGGRRR